MGMRMSGWASLRLPYAWLLFLCLILGVHTVVNQAQAPTQVTIGALLPLTSTGGSSGDGINPADPTLRQAFDSAIAEVNADPSILPTTTIKGVFADTQADPFVGLASYLSMTSSGTGITDTPVCIIGPGQYQLAKAIEPLSTDSTLPIISPLIPDARLAENEYFLRTIASDTHEAEALVQVIKHFGWKRVTVVHSTDSAGTSAFNRFTALTASDGVQIITPIRVDVGATHEDISFALARTLNSRIFVVFAPASLMQPILTVASNYTLIGNGVVFMSTSSFVHPQALVPGSTLAALAAGLITTRPAIDATDLNGQSIGYVATQNAVRAAARALHAFFAGGGTLTNSKTGANGEYRWSSGPALLTHLLSTSFSYPQGTVGFTSQGEQTHWTLEIANLAPQATALSVIGSWSPTSGLTMSASPTFSGGVLGDPIPGDAPNITTVTLRTVTAASRPFIYINESFTDPERRFTGFTVDVWREVARRIGIKYTIERRPPDTSFNEVIGMIGEGIYDLGILDAWVTPSRFEIIEFSTSYYPDGYTMVAGPSYPPFSLTTFLHPFHWSIWVLIVVTVVIMSHALWGIEMLASKDGRAWRPAEVADPVVPNKQGVRNIMYSHHTQEDEDKGRHSRDDGGSSIPRSQHDMHHHHHHHKNSVGHGAGSHVAGGTGKPWQNDRSPDYNADGTVEAMPGGQTREELSLRKQYKRDVRSTLWFSFNSLFFNHNPEQVRSVPGRILVTIWMFVVLVLLSLYTAQMASFLTAPTERTIRGENDLLRLHVGIRAGIGLVPYVESKNPKKLSYYNTTAAMMDDLKAGKLDVVVHGTSNAQYLAASDCDLELIGAQLRLVMTSFPMRPGFPFKREIDLVLGQMWEEGFLMTTLKSRWFGQGTCDTSAVVQPLSYRHLFGVFVMLFIASCLVAGTVLWTRYQARRNRDKHSSPEFDRPHGDLHEIDQTSERRQRTNHTTGHLSESGTSVLPSLRHGDNHAGLSYSSGSDDHDDHDDHDGMARSRYGRDHSDRSAGAGFGSASSQGYADRRDWNYQNNGAASDASSDSRRW